MENKSIHDYVFHYSQYTNLWNAIPRELYLEYWTQNDVKGILKSKEMDTLIELINKGEEFIEKL